MKEMSIPTLSFHRTVAVSHNWNVHHSVVTAILHSFLNHLLHQHLSMQRDSAMR